MEICGKCGATNYGIGLLCGECGHVLDPFPQPDDIGVLLEELEGAVFTDDRHPAPPRSRSTPIIRLVSDESF